MQSNALATLLRNTLLAGLADKGAGYTDVQVKQVFQPLTVGVPSPPQVTMQFVGSYRVGALGRKYTFDPLNPADMEGRMLQWWNTTVQVGCTARRNPTSPDFLTLPSAMDICKVASDILQSDKGLTALAVQGVRPLRIADIRLIQWVNESGQYEAWPIFDLVLVYLETLTTTTPPVVTFEPETRMV
jgi:hypothetical protein